MTDAQKTAIYEAFLQAAIAMGPRLREISWFGRNAGIVEYGLDTGLYKSTVKPPSRDSVRPSS